VTNWRGVVCVRPTGADDNPPRLRPEPAAVATASQADDERPGASIAIGEPASGPQSDEVSARPALAGVTETECPQ
jgi:hypothetical protein